MWYYFYSHCIYHLTRWLPQNNRIKFRIVVVLLSAALLIPEIIVLNLPKTSRACDQPLLSLLVASLIFLFFSVGFALLFSIMDPVPKLVKIVFHVFGVSSLILGAITALFTFQSEACATSTVELYYWCLTSSYLALITTGYFILAFPFWIINHVKPRSVLDWKKRSGVCYEPVICCSCIWHI